MAKSRAKAGKRLGNQLGRSGEAGTKQEQSNGEGRSIVKQWKNGSQTVA